VRERPLGRTGLTVTELSLGTWGFSGGYGTAESDFQGVLHRALDLGIRLFDTADVYAGGATEAHLGQTLAGRSDVVIATRVGTDVASDPPRKRFDSAYVRVAIDRSRKRLREPENLVVLLHNPSTASLENTDLISDIKAWQSAGLVRAWGVAAGDAEVARAAIRHGAEVLELAYNLFAGRDLHAISGDVLVDRVGILARSTLAYGLLAALWAEDKEFPEGDHRRTRWTRVEMERRVRQLAALRFLVRGDVHTMRGAAVRYVLSNPLVSSAVLGPRSIVQLEQLLRETGTGPRYLPDDSLRRLPAVLEGVGVET
jgi:aryl-alcohol dehydrogenase-like predicted oxidoreductase